MKPRFLLYTLAFLFLIVSFASCKKEKVDVMDKNKAIELFSLASQEYKNMIGHFDASPVAPILTQFDQLMEKAYAEVPKMGAYYSVFRSTMLENRLVPNVLHLIALSKEYVTHEAYNTSGVYSWNGESESWTLVEEGDELIYIFSSGLSEFDEVELSFTKYGVSSINSPNSWEIELRFQSEPLVLIKYEFWESSDNVDMDLYFSIYPYGTYAMVMLQDQDEGLDVTYLKRYGKDDLAFHGLDVEITYQGLTHTDYFSNTNFSSIAPFIIMGGFIEHTGFMVPISFDVKEFLNYPSDKQIANFANRHLFIDFKTFPSEEVIGDCKWYYNKHEGILEPFIVFANEDEEPLNNYYPHFDPIIISNLGINF